VDSQNGGEDFLKTLKTGRDKARRQMGYHIPSRKDPSTVELLTAAVKYDISSVIMSLCNELFQSSTTTLGTADSIC
jgi:hypothetical protein